MKPRQKQRPNKKNRKNAEIERLRRELDLARRRAKTTNGFLLQNPPKPPKAKRARNNRNNNSIVPLLTKAAGGFIAAKIASSIKGFGAYTLKKNSLLTGVPMFANSNGRFIFQRQEYLGEVTPSVAYNLVRYPINPGQSATFPWLSEVAKCFEQWVPHGIGFYFRSMSSPNVLSEAANTSLGSVVMSTQYDPKDAPFVDKAENENYWCTVSGVPYRDLMHLVECAKNQTLLNELLVRIDDQPAESDLSFYDLGNFDIATVGNPAGTGSIGELWVTYCIELLKPKIPEQPTPSDAGTDLFSLTTVTNTRCLGSSAPTIIVNSLGATVDTTGFGTIILNDVVPNGTNLMMVYCIIGSSTAITPPSITLTGLDYNTDYVSSAAFNNGTTNTELITACVKVTNSVNCSIAFSGANTPPSSISNSKLMLTVVDSTITKQKEDDLANQVQKLQEQIQLLMNQV